MLGKNNDRLRGQFGDNGHFKFGNPNAWESLGKSTKWAIKYSNPLVDWVMADNSIVKGRKTSGAMLEIDLAQSHVDEMQLLDLLMNSPSISFWGDMGSADGDDMECYIPELIAGGDLNLETPSNLIKIPLVLGIQPQDGLFSFQGADLPLDSQHGDTIITSLNKFYHPFVVVP
jgi:hypothetical protein